MIGPKNGATSQTFKKERQSKMPNVREIIFFLSLERGSAAKSWCRFPTIFASKLRLDSLVRIKRPLPDSGSSRCSSSQPAVVAVAAAILAVAVAVVVVVVVVVGVVLVVV